MKVAPVPKSVGRPHRDIAPGTVVVPCGRQDVALLTAKTTDGSRLLIDMNTGWVLDITAADNFDVMGFVSYPNATLKYE